MTVEEIQSVIDTWQGLELDAKNYQDIMYLRKRLAGLTFELGRVVAREKGDFDKAYAAREAAFYKRKKEHINAGTTIGEAEAQAKVDIKDMKGTEKHHESLYTGYKVILNQGNEVLSSMQQDLAILREQ